MFPCWRMSLTLLIVSKTIACSHASGHTCSLEDRICVSKYEDSALQPMTYDLDYGEESFMAYVVPEISTFYEKPPSTKKQKKPRFNGLAGKFFNNSPEPMKLFWDPGNASSSMLIAHAAPFKAVGTATFPGHLFYFVLAKSSSGPEIRHRFYVNDQTNLYVYDPFMSDDSDRSVDELSPEEYEKYISQRRTLKFSMYYREFTGRDWISRFPRAPPVHYIWPADHLGQQHMIETSETHFVTLPPKDKLPKVSKYGMTEKERQQLQSYRGPEPTISLNLTALSIAPRVFEIKNFLNAVEIDHIMELATGMSLGLSTVSGGESAGNADTKTRTSTNTWVYRETSPIVDSIYRRAADVLRIDEALLRNRRKHEFPDFPAPGRAGKQTIAEALQLVHYDVGQEYTAHHDFGYPDVMHPDQPARFATLLLYLNEGMIGGETAFPRWINADTRESLKVTPESGKAILFYSFLPDGNMDDLSQHTALPVKKGEKWLMNLWVWEPVYA